MAASLIFLAHRRLSAPWFSEVSLFDASPWRGAAVAASIPAAVVKEKGGCNDRQRENRRQVLDALPRSLVEGRHRRLTQRPTHQPSWSQSSPPIPLPPVPDVPREIWEAQLSLRIKHKWTRDSPQVVREGWGALMALQRHAKSPQHAQTSHCRWGCHGRDIQVTQPDTPDSSGADQVRAVGPRSGIARPRLRQSRD